MSDKRVGLLVSCTKRKRGRMHSRMLFHTLGRMNVDLLVGEWIQRMKSTDGQSAVKNLYCGPGWACVRAACTEVEETFGRVSLYALSAGFGLLRAEDSVPPYSATFASGEDQIARQIAGSSSTVEAHRQWWHAIKTARQEEWATALADLRSEDYVVVAASVDYLEAAADDLTQLALALGRERLFIISVVASRASLDESVKSCLLPTDSTIEEILPGPRSSINQRALLWFVGTVIPKASWDREAIEAEMLACLASCQQRRAIRPKRVVCKMDDLEVKEWIRVQLLQQPNMPRSRLLRLLRSDQRSCEQSRFSRLVDDVKAERPML